MTDAQIELLKVIFDKGLLAAILLLLGFLFTRKLERYRTAAAYFNKLAERRIDAYDNLLRGLSESMHSLRHILDVVEQGRTMFEGNGSYDLEALSREVHREFEQMQEQIIRLQNEWGSDIIYVSQNLALKIDTVLDDYISFLNVFFGESSGSLTADRLIEMRQAYDSLMKS